MKANAVFRWLIMLVVIGSLALAGMASDLSQAAKAGGAKAPTVSHTARQTRPIQLGTSGGSVTGAANGYVSSGTLGALVQDAAKTQYILSNTHVFAGDTVPGGNGIISQVGDAINQPGYVDVNGANIPADYVATLSYWIPIVRGGTSTVDAAMAQVLPGMVDPQGRILEIGAISAQPTAAFLAQKVKKSGRTTGLTQGKVAGLNATVNVQYTDECAGNTYISTFKGQILVTPGSFLKAGDSGSLMVENVGVNPRAVGLLYAGGANVAVANPVQGVLSALGVTLVGVTTAGSTSVTSGNGMAAEVANAARTKSRNETRLMTLPSAVGHAVGLKTGNPNKAAILVLVEKMTPAAQTLAPKEIDGVPVELWEVGKIVAY